MSNIHIETSNPKGDGIDPESGRLLKFQTPFPKAKIRLELTDPLVYIVADSLTHGEALAQLLSAAAQKKQVPRYHWADGTPAFHYGYAPPHVLATTGKTIAMMETKDV